MNHSNPERDRLWLLCHELMLVAGVDGTILATNPSWRRLLGWDEAELRGIKFFELVHPDDLQKTMDEAARLAGGSANVRLDSRYRRKDSSYLRISWTVVADEKYLYAIGRDASIESGESLRQEQEIDAVGRFAGVVAHDFNNLLQGIVGSMELVRKLIKMGRAQETERFIDNAMSSVKRATTLTERLHAFSSRASDLKPVEVNGLIDSVKDLLHSSLPPSIKMKLALSATLWTTLCDAGQLENALLNLVTNSRDAMPDGGTIAIETSNVDIDDNLVARADGTAPGQYACVAVSDSGTGMSGETVRQAFDPLFTTKKTGLASGLGLSMVYAFARQVQGCVRIHSEPGRGTTVKLYLPRHHGREANSSGQTT